MPPKSVNFQQIRGSWIAIAASARDAEWRSLLEAGTPTLIRKGTGSDDGFGENSVGRKVGLFVPSAVNIVPDLLELRFATRLPFALTQ